MTPGHCGVLVFEGWVWGGVDMCDVLVMLDPSEAFRAGDLERPLLAGYPAICGLCRAHPGRRSLTRPLLMVIYSSMHAEAR